MAEAHPVGFQYVVEAKKRGAKIIHVDPRFTRTSALAHTYVPVRAGADIAFLGGIVNYILSNELDFREYVLAYTNASTLVSEEFRDTEDLDGLFSGYDPQTNTYDQSSWQYDGQQEQSQDEDESHTDRETASGLEQESHGPPVPADVPRDPTLQHPRCVYQVLKRHYARYTPEVVEQVCGVPQDKFLEVCEAWTRNSGRERTTALVYSVGWTQHSVGRAVHPHRGDHPVAAGQHGPARRRCHGAARARQHPGLHRHPDAVQPAARLPADAAPPPARDVPAMGGRDPAPGAEGLLGQRRGVRGQPAQGVLG